MENKYCRGDIYYADLKGAIGSEQSGIRPVVIVQNDIGNKHSNTVIVAPLTKKIDKRIKIPTHVIVEAFGNIIVDSTILTEQLRVLDKQRLTRKVGKLSNELLEQVDNALGISVGII